MRKYKIGGNQKRRKHFDENRHEVNLNLGDTSYILHFPKVIKLEINKQAQSWYY